ncbi:MAG: hypothetical protein ACKVT2_16825 [Saprospiraceae bacterium]
MGAPELKSSIHQMLDDTEDPEVLALVYALLKKFTLLGHDDYVVGYEADGTPISDDEFVSSILSSSQEAKSGKVLTHEEMKTLLGLHE